MNSSPSYIGNPSLFLQVLTLMLVYLNLTGQSDVSWWLVFLPIALPYIVVIVGGTLLYLYRRATGYDFKADEEKVYDISLDSPDDINAFVSSVINASKGNKGGPSRDDKLNKFFDKK